MSTLWTTLLALELKMNRLALEQSTVGLAAQIASGQMAGVEGWGGQGKGEEREGARKKIPTETSVALAREAARPVQLS